MSTFKKATKKQAKLRLAVFGTSGSGKTFTALRIAKGMGGKIAVIDSERGSASKYSDRFDFDIMELQPCNIDSLIPAIEQAQDGGYEVLIIDSLTHSWQELLEEIDKLAKTKYGTNTWGAWAEGTPKQKKLVNAILNYNGHIIATMRSKTEWTLEQDSKGRNKPVRVGLSPEAGKGIEYEFDMLMEISPEHFATIIKDRTGMFQDKIIEKPTEKFGKQLVDWLNSGEPYQEKKEEPKADPVIKDPPKNKTNWNLQMAIDELKKYMDMYALPKSAYEALEKGIADGKFDMKRITIFHESCDKYDLKPKYMATEEEILLFIDSLNQYDISKNIELLKRVADVENSMKITKMRLDILKEEAATCPKKAVKEEEKEPDFSGIPDIDVDDPEKKKGKKDLFNQKLPAGAL